LKINPTLLQPNKYDKFLISLNKVVIN